MKKKKKRGPGGNDKSYQKRVRGRNRSKNFGRGEKLGKVFKSTPKQGKPEAK